MIGEYPELPPAVIMQLRASRQNLADWAWQQMADRSVTVFEQYRGRRN